MGRLALGGFIPEVPHHITQRGNRRGDVFFDDDGRQGYLNLIRHYSRLHQVRIWSYCLMTNHVHFVVVPAHAEGLALLFRDTHTAYAAGVNRRRRLSGHLWQGRFFSTPCWMRRTSGRRCGMSSVIRFGRVWSHERKITREVKREGALLRTSERHAHERRRHDQECRAGRRLPRRFEWN